ncbi:MAG TPA: HAMP domain-containing sensor histidine kinase [Rectinemataceae bacterium]|nr:HAMP domain-containing sensor histidine kinase [Rectinemataceae bacterium]
MSRLPEEILAESTAKDALLLSLSRQAALGGLVSHLSHQWRQPLNVLGLVFQAIQLQNEAGSSDAKTIEGYIQKGLDEIEALNRLLDEYRSYYRPEDDEGSFPLRETLESCLRLHSPAIDALRVETKVECPPDLIFQGRRSALRELLMSLVAHSLAAFAGRGIREPRIALSARATPEATIAIEVRDNGGILTPPLLGALFEADFADKGGGIRTGLYVCRLIAERELGGRIAATSVEEGIAFEISLPWRGEA